MSSKPFLEAFENEFPTSVAEIRAIERERIRTELIDWLIGPHLDPKDAGLVNGRRIVDEIDRICPPSD